MRTRDKIAISIFSTLFVGGMAYGSAWATNFDINGTLISILLFGALWLSVQYMVWMMEE